MIKQHGEKENSFQFECMVFFQRPQLLPIIDSGNKLSKGMANSLENCALIFTLSQTGSAHSSDENAGEPISRETDRRNFYRWLDSFIQNSSNSYTQKAIFN